ncbi:MAG: hypothetical protein HY562_06135 [Ignavibacteriales bacterium]|nr:hypothetical protein [Ignavibacteriales bacterium]
MNHRGLLRSFALGALLAMSISSGAGQQLLTDVRLDLPAFNYDVLYLADFIDVASRKLASNIADFSGSIVAVPDGAAGQIYLKVNASIRLQGDASPIDLVRAQTEPFRLAGRRTLSSRDLASGSTSEIKIANSPYFEDATQKKRLEDYAARFPTAPVGEYILELEAFDAVTNTSFPGSRTIKTITIRNASPDEVIVTLLDPQPGAIVATILPTFSWSSPNPKVKLSVYEKLPVHQSAQEAVTGIPYLNVDLVGLSTYTYPADAPRRLEQNKTYVWFVETEVSTNRGTVRRRSELNVFRIQTSNPQQQAVEQLLNSLGSSAAGTFATLQNIGWSPSGDLTLDGKRLTREELANLITRLTGQNIEFHLRVENVAR